MAVGSFKLPNVTIPVVDPSGWTRPSDWLAMPTIGAQEFIGLLSITDDESNYVALLCAGAYTVDWGDGVTENVATGVKAQHQYTYSSISGTPTTRGYKQVLVRVTPQAGQNLTRVDIAQQHSAIVKTQSTAWLDIAINSTNLTTLTLGGLTLYHGLCENVDIYSMGAITNLGSLFQNFYSLQKFTLANSNLVTNWSNAFDGCRSLKTVPLFNMASAQQCVSMFYICSALQSIPLLVTTNVVNAQQMFWGCSALRTVPLLDLSNCANTIYMFQGCYSLYSVPLFNLIKVTNATQMFYQCWSLQSIPNFNFTLSIGLDSILASTSVARGAFQNVKVNNQYTGLFYSQSAIVEIFNGLSSGVVSKTVSVSGNPGYAALTAAERLIATAKGWTIA